MRGLDGIFLCGPKTESYGYEDYILLSMITRLDEDKTSLSTNTHWLQLVTQLWMVILYVVIFK